MIRYTVRRLLVSIPVLFFLSLVVFMLIHLTRGDPVAMIFVGGGYPEPAKVQEIRRQLGLDLPLHEQYARWIVRGLHGDLGTSIRTRQPVAAAILERLPVTLELAALSLLFALIVALGVGLAAGLWPSRWLNTLTSAFVLCGVAIPPFLLGILLILTFSQYLKWLPPSGYMPLSKSLVGNLRLMILPTITLGMSLALIARMTQATLTDVLGREYVVVARAKGLPERLVVLRHAFKNTLLPLITVISLESGTILGGVVLTEVIFGIPGLGRFVVDNVLARDYPMVQGAVLTLALTRLGVNLGADILYGLADPRIRSLN